MMYFTLSLDSKENMSFFGSGISGSLIEEILFDESFLLLFNALLSSECLGTSAMQHKQVLIKPHHIHINTKTCTTLLCNFNERVLKNTQLQHHVSG